MLLPTHALPRQGTFSSTGDSFKSLPRWKDASAMLLGAPLGLLRQRAFSLDPVSSSCPSVKHLLILPEEWSDPGPSALACGGITQLTVESTFTALSFLSRTLT